MNRWWLAYTCPDCGSPAGQECDESCPSGLAAYIEQFEADYEAWEHLTPLEVEAIRDYLTTTRGNAA